MSIESENTSTPAAEASAAKGARQVAKNLGWGEREITLIRSNR